MKNLLVATDFSDNGNAAVHYAMQLANVFNAQVHILNSFITIPAVGIDGGTGSLKQSVTESGMAENKTELDQIAAKTAEEVDFKGNYETFIAEGDAVVSITRYAEENNCDLIVLGTKGDSRLEEILFGSTTVEVMRKANVPVLSIPNEAEYYGIKKIVYASDLVEQDIAVINKLCELAEFFDAEVVVFHVFTEDNMTNQDDADTFNELLEEKVKYKKLSKESVTYGNTHDAILEVVKKDLANMIALREQDRGIFSRLFHTDMVKRINDHTTIPLLAFNDRSV